MPVQIPNDAFAVKTFRDTNYSAARNPDLRQSKSLTNISQSVLGVIPRKSHADLGNNRITFGAAAYDEGDVGASVVVIPHKPAFLIIDLEVINLADPTLQNEIYVEESDDDFGADQTEVKDQDWLFPIVGDVGLYTLQFLPTKAFVRMSFNIASGEGPSEVNMSAIILQP